jgi:SAM-dependent methyltransferase
MDVRDRALLDLDAVTKHDSGISTVRLNPEESRYLEFKTRVNRILDELPGAQSKRDFLEQYFVGFLPALLCAAADHEGWDTSSCTVEQEWLVEIMQLGHGLLAHSPMLFPLNRKVFRQVPDGTPSLDLGIGSGQNSRFSLRGRSLDVGADIILSNLLKARSIRSHDQFAALDMCALPFTDGSFERVYALNCVYHAHLGRDAAVEEMARVLAPGGILALTDVSPFLNTTKPLASFMDAMGFENLKADFTRYFLSGYGADSTTGSEEWYYAELPRRGFEDVRVQYLLSSRLSAISYLFYDWQALFNFDVHTPLVAQGSRNRYWQNYSKMLTTVIAPLLQQDEQICRKEKKGGYIFVTARRKAGGKASLFHGNYACPECRVQLATSLDCRRCGRRFPMVEDIPLLTTFYAESLRTSA